MFRGGRGIQIPTHHVWDGWKYRRNIFQFHFLGWSLFPSAPSNPHVHRQVGYFSGLSTLVFQHGVFQFIVLKQVNSKKFEIWWEKNIITTKQKVLPSNLCINLCIKYWLACGFYIFFFYSSGNENEVSFSLI